MSNNPSRVVYMLKTLRSLSTIGLFTTLSFTATAQTSVDDIVLQAKKRAAAIEEYKALLSTPDPTIRLAGLDALLSSDDPVARQVAYDIGFNSIEAAMQSVALRHKLGDLSAITFNLEPQSNNSSEEEREWVDEMAGVLPTRVVEYNATTGAIILDPKGKTHTSGQVDNLRLSTQGGYCQFNLELKEGGSLSGGLLCGNRGNYKVSTNLL
jgi:hypothetical protein